MHTVDRQGIRLEQCDNCRGIFLDYGELEQVLTAEQRYYGGGSAPSAAPTAGYPGTGHHRAGHHEVGYHGAEHHGGHPDSPRASAHRDSPRPYREDRHDYRSDSPRPYGHRRGHGSFLGDLFG